MSFETLQQITSGIPLILESSDILKNTFKNPPKNLEPIPEKAKECPIITQKIDIKQTILKCWDKTERTFIEQTKSA